MNTPFFVIFLCLIFSLGCKSDPEPKDNILDDQTAVELRDSTVYAAIDSVLQSEKPGTNEKPEDPSTNSLNQEKPQTSKNQPTQINQGTNNPVPVKPSVNPADLISNEPLIVFKEMEHEFEKVKEGENIKYNFEFQNLGKKPLVISNASSPCSCTFAEFPLEPILPGHSGAIKALFTTKGFYGKQVKTINVTSNAENDLVSLKINGMVEEVEAFAKEREEQTKQWEKDKKEMEKQQAEMKKALEVQKKRQAIADSIEQVKTEQAIKDSLNRAKQVMEDSLKSGN